MGLFAIGDLHLSLSTGKPMDIFGGGWEGHVEKIRRGFERVTDNDTVILCGDLSWGMTLLEAEPDFRFIDSLPGRKILIKGNHDYWFETANKTARFLSDAGMREMPLLNNNSFSVNIGDAENPHFISICGTRGWMNDEHGDDHDGKIVRREIMRLKASLKCAEHKEIFCFFHYPPRYGNSEIEGFIDAMLEAGVSRCCYGHIHGASHGYAAQGNIGGIEYRMVSADYLNFIPYKIQ